MARKFFREYLKGLRRKGGIIFLPVAIFAFLAPAIPAVKAETINVVIFSYSQQYIEQTVDISSFAGSLATLSAGATGKNTEGGPDLLGVELTVFDASSVEVYSANSDAQLASMSDDWSMASTYVDASQEDTSSWSSLRIRVWGKDAENWGGNYGPMLRAVSLIVDNADQTSLLTNSTFSSVTSNAPDGWTSSQSWDTCQGLYAATLCVGSIETQDAPPETTTTTTTTTPPTTTTTLPPVSSGLEYWAFQSSGGSPTEPSDKSGAISSGWVEGLDMNWSGGQILDTGRSDGVILWFEGFIQPSTAGIYDLYICSDDGMRLRLDDELVIDNWFDRGTSCSQPYSADFSNGQSKAIKVSWYENGGGAAVILRYKDASNSIVTVPFSWYYYGGTPSSNSPSTTTTTTTTVPQSIGAPLNLTVTEIENGFFLDWDEPTEGNVSPERYAVSWEIEGIGGWGWATGNVGDENALITEITVPYSILESTGGLDQTYVFSIRSDNDTLGMYSSLSNTVELLVSSPTATTTLPPTTTTAPPTTTTTPPAPVVAPPPVTSAAPTTAPPTTAPPTTAAPTTVATTAPTTVATTTPTTAPTTAPTTVATTVVKTTEPATTQPQKETETSLAQPEQPTEPKPEENQNPVSEPETNTENEAETGQEVVEVLDTVEELIAAISDSGSVAEFSSQQLAEVFSEENLSSLDDEEIAELIDAIDVESLSDEQAEAIAISLSSAPDDVKEEFESEINVFSGTFDSYVPKGSTISVGQRRLIVAATAVIFAMPAPVVSRSRGV